MGLLRIINWINRRNSEYNPTEIAEILEGKSELGVELASGRIKSREARIIQKRTYKHLRNWGVVLGLLEDEGYTPEVVRALLTNHFEKLALAPADSDAGAVWIDLFGALNQLKGSRQQAVAKFVIWNCTKAEFEANGWNKSKETRLLCKELSRLLKGDVSWE